MHSATEGVSPTNALKPDARVAVVGTRLPLLPSSGIAAEAAPPKSDTVVDAIAPTPTKTPVYFSRMRWIGWPD
jgi:hypothetical protein